MPMDPADYPKDWKLRSRFVRFYRAKNRCEWCGAENYKPHPITGSKVVLTTAHVHDKTKSNGSLLNLAALCQRCHLNHDKHDRIAKDAESIVVKNCRSFVRKRIRESGHAKIAAMLGYSPSDLTRKLRQYKGDSRKFTSDDFERYLQGTGDIQPIMYLVDKYAPELRPQILQWLHAQLATAVQKEAQQELF